MQNLKIVFLGFLGGIIAVFLLLSLPGSGPFIFGFIKRVSDPSARARALSYLGMNSHLDPQQIISIYQEIKKLDLKL